jgi:DNA invertase Pin-like site-specific DNA recombinase
MMTVGYARVSTHEQFLENQIHLLKEFGCEKVYTDIAGGVREERTGLKEMSTYLRAGDMVVVFKIDRIFRSLKNLVNLVDHFNRHQIQFKSLSEPEFDTTSSNGRFLLQIFGAVAEFERNLISERTRLGLTSARKRKNCWADPKALKKKRLKNIMMHNIFMKPKTLQLIKPVN